MSIVYRNVREEPFEIFGLDDTAKDIFRRMPLEVAEKVSEPVKELHNFTTGGRIRFRTDSDKIWIRVKIGNGAPHTSTTTMMRAGFDLYMDTERSHKYLGIFYFDISMYKEYNTYVLNVPEGDKELTINMPLMAEVLSVEIGLEDTAKLEKHSPYIPMLPIVFYGSSITQGNCVSRPGLLYSSIISRKYNVDFKCLGFSGSCKAEPEMVEYLSGLEMSAFVSDYDYNAPTPEYLRETHYTMYQKIREKHPNIPYFMISKPNFKFEADDTERRCIIMESYIKAHNSGDKNVYFIDGSAIFNGVDIGECTMDGTHPIDMGAERMAKYIGDVIAKVMML